VVEYTKHLDEGLLKSAGNALLAMLVAGFGLVHAVDEPITAML
jgi:hypothetical protein